MAQRFLVALALAHSATALLDGRVDVLVRVDEVQVVADALAAGAMQAAAGADDGYGACVTANAVLEGCSDAGYLDSTAAPASAFSCMCCLDNTAIASAYSDCASYASDVPSASRALDQVYSLCSVQGSCRAGPTPTSTRAATRSATQIAGSQITMPAVCASMTSIYNSCSRKLEPQTTARNSDAASCFCHDKSGDYNTAFQDYASSCAPWAETAFPADVPLIEKLETFCDAYPPNTRTGSLEFSTRSGGGGGFALSSTGSPASSPTGQGASNTEGASAGDPTGEDAGNPEATSSSTGLAAPGLAVPGFLAWFANLATVLLSFFILI
ncbi:hypothetical protein C8A00DRAFT_31769 [Chaetomidium leptoderma]|uniref:Uncharacterized protein n=1 Tax=Chaetomidium leptoderma TaxID=669021 RepID=A0AAN6VQG3_9PEZI|nr:hypothetical protein C8A00DRAFT_31769 [Chaetomidium leptoderma]